MPTVFDYLEAKEKLERGWIPPNAEEVRKMESKFSEPIEINGTKGVRVDTTKIPSEYILGHPERMLRFKVISFKLSLDRQRSLHSKNFYYFQND